MESSSYLNFIQDEVYPTLSKFSTAMACIVVLIMICLSIYDYSLVDRVSLRLQTVISCYDIWLHTAQIWKRQYETGPSLMCTFIGWQYVFFPLLYAFLNVSVAVNLQLVFFHNVNITRKIEALYWIIPILLGLIISIPPLALGKLGYSEFNGCYTTEKDETYGRLFDLYSYEVPMLIIMAYLIIVIIAVLIKLNQGIVVLKKGNTSLDVKSIKTIKLLGYRILLYPIVLIVSHFGFVVANIYYDVNPVLLDNLDNLDIWNMTCRGLAGTLNLIAFLCDPTIQNAFIKVYYDFTNKNTNNKKDGILKLDALQSSENDIENGGRDLMDDQDEQVSNLIRSL